MRPTTKHKVVTSGRLTGSGRLQLSRKQVSPHPGPAARPEPTYSLYSTDSEDQVTTLHRGLDRCAALLGGFLQAEEGTGTGGGPRPRPGPGPSSSVGKKTLKKPQKKKTGQKIPQSGQQGPGSATAPRPGPGPGSPAAAAAHSGVKLHPPQKPVQTRVQSLVQSRVQSHPQRLQQVSTSTSTAPSKSQSPSVLLSVVQSSSRSDHRPDFLSGPEAPPTTRRHTEEEEEEPVAVRDDADHAHCAARTTKTKTHLDSGPAGDVPQDSVQNLLRELKTLIAGRGSVAERLLSHLEEMVNLNQPLEETERQQDTGTLANTEVTTLRQELSAAQSGLQEVQSDLRELRRALRDTQDQLRATEAQNTATSTELEDTKRRLAESEREKSQLASEMEDLRRILQSRDSSGSPTLTDGSGPETEQKPAAAPERIAQYLMSLGPKTLIPIPIPVIHPRDTAETHRDSSSALSRCDVESSVAFSDWTLRSCSTFDTRDEAAFRDGLAALDASIANLQKTIQLDLRR